MLKKVSQTLVTCLIMIMAGVTSLRAQERTITGTVQENGDEPLVGVAVIQDGVSNNGVLTGVDGKFSIKVPAKDVTLEFKLIGFVPQKVKVPANRNNIVVTLAEDRKDLDEVIVVGYGTQKKVNLTGAISTVDSKALENRTAHSLTNMLQGAVAGLNITNSAGHPGSSGSLNIRGVTSISGNNEPLVLVDGAEGDLSQVNADDVANISVIKDASAAAIYGARAAFGVILVTTKKGESPAGKGATLKYSGKWGWENPTTSTDYENRGYWSVYTANAFWKADTGSKYIDYDDYDMMQLLARVNDKTENPERPWVVVTKNKSGQDSYKYYGNTDWYHELFQDNHATTQHNISLSGGTKDIHYYVSGAYDHETGILKQNPDEFNRFNLRSKIDFKINKWATFSNNTSFFRSNYSYIGVNGIEDAISYGNAHGLSCFVPKNPDGTWVYKTDWTSYAVANGRHIVFGLDNNINKSSRQSFNNTSELVLKPLKHLTVVGNFTFKNRRSEGTHRKTNFTYSMGPDRMGVYNSGAGQNQLSESSTTSYYYATNAYATYENTWNQMHHFTATGGMNYETMNMKTVGVVGKNLISDTLHDLDLVGTNANGEVELEANGGQSEYALMGYFGRVNYDYKGRYLAEFSGRYDGSSRFAKGSRWGFFPSASAGWRISDEPFFAPLTSVINNMKIRASYGTLGNQQVSNYAWMRTISLETFKGFSFNEGTGSAKYTTISAPNASDLTWEVTHQYNLGLDISLWKNHLELTAETYIRDTKGMLVSGNGIPAVYGASAPKENSADLRTKGYELSLIYRGDVKIAGKKLNYFVRGTLSDYRSEITKYDNPNKTFGKPYYKGMRLGEIWGFKTDGLFQSDAEAQNYASQVDLSYINKRLTGGWLAGDVKYRDLDGDNKLSIGSNTVDDPGDRTILGNSLPSLQYGITVGADYAGFDFQIFLQGTGNHYYYPDSEMTQFWGGFSRPYVSYLPKGFIDNCWSEDNPGAYLPRPRAYAALTSGAELYYTNDRYLQNARYLRLKNLTIGYTLPKAWTMKAKIEKLRLYFTGENMAYCSPLKKHCKYIDPEAMSNLGYSDSRFYNAIYPWQASYMFGVDITF